MRFFFITTLRKPWTVSDTPYPRQTFRLPKVLSQDQVARLIEAASTPFYRMILMTLYATSVRRAELTKLRISDIDSERMVIHVRESKGGKDRDVMLSARLLDELRQYWRGLSKKPKVWLFPGNRWHTGATPISTKVPWQACRDAAVRGLCSEECANGATADLSQYSLAGEQKKGGQWPEGRIAQESGTGKIWYGRTRIFYDRWSRK